MKKIFKKLLCSVKGSLNLTGIVIDVVLLCALIPVVTSLISRTGDSCTSSNHFINLTANLCHASGNMTSNASIVQGLGTTETVVLALTTIFLVLALVFSIAKQAGLIKNN